MNGTQFVLYLMDRYEAQELKMIDYNILLNGRKIKLWPGRMNTFHNSEVVQIS